MDAAQNPWAFDETWRLNVMLPNPTAGNASTMRSTLSAMENAFLKTNQDLALLLETGGKTHHAVRSRDTVGGIRVTKFPEYPVGRGYEYGSYRTVAIELSMRRLVDLSDRSGLTNFSETLTTSGGGPRYGHLEPLTGLAIKQLLKQNTIWRAVQQGVAIGIGGYPTPPDPIWPGDLVEPDGSPFTYGSPERIGGSLFNFPVTWQYNFEAAQPRRGRPNVWR